MVGSKLPKYAVAKMKLVPVQAVLISTITHWLAPVVLVKVYSS